MSLRTCFKHVEVFRFFALLRFLGAAVLEKECLKGVNVAIFFFFFFKEKAKTSLTCSPSGWFISHRVDEDECFDRLDDVRILLPAWFVENAMNGFR